MRTFFHNNFQMFYIPAHPFNSFSSMRYGGIAFQDQYIDLSIPPGVQGSWKTFIVEEVPDTVAIQYNTENPLEPVKIYNLSRERYPVEFSGRSTEELLSLLRAASNYRGYSKYYGRFQHYLDGLISVINQALEGQREFAARREQGLMV